MSFYMRWFNRKSNRLLGIDISTATIKLLELSKTRKGYKVESYAVRPITDEKVVNNNEEDMQGIAETLKAVVQASGTGISSVCLGISEDHVTKTVVSMPKGQTEDDREEQLLMDIDSLDVMSFDFGVINSPPDKDAEDVLVVYSHAENISDRVNILEKAGLVAKVIDLESFATLGAFELIRQQLPNNAEGKVVGIVDVGASTLNLNVIEQGRSIYAGDKDFGGNKLTEDIQSTYGCTYEEAGKLKRSATPPDNYEKKVLEPFKRRMVMEISRELNKFYSSKEAKSIDYVILAGGCASIKGIAKTVESEVSAPTYIANPFMNMQVASKVNKSRFVEDAPALLLTCGLALRSFDNES